MKAIIRTEQKEVKLVNLPAPETAAPQHMIVRMEYMGINAGDRAFISGEFAPGFFPESKYGIGGVSGVGRVMATGDGVPAYYQDKMVTVYRSLRFSDDLIGTWSEYAQLHYLQCAILPETVDPIDYSGSLVNIITPYAFLKQIQAEGHKGIINTAGNSATGMAMVGLCLTFNIPVISIVRNSEAKKALEAFGAAHVLVEQEDSFQEDLRQLSAQLSTTAIFDGVGGEILNKIIGVIPAGSCIYVYGFLGGPTPFSFHTAMLMRGISIRPFGNFRTETVQDPLKLKLALEDISSIIHMPHFKTKVGNVFAMEEFDEALSCSFVNGGKAVLQVFAE